MSVVNEAIQDGVAECWIADNVVPMFDWDLAGNDGGGATVAIIEISRRSRRSGGLRTDRPQSSRIRS